jgi:hypothetical protein
MACRTLLRRRAQLALLERACQQRLHATLDLRRKRMVTGSVQLTAMERDGVLAAWTGARLEDAETSGQPVEVRFTYEGAPYVFFSVTRGFAHRAADGRKDARLVKLSLPLRLERARHRRNIRVSLEQDPPVRGTFTHVVDGRRQFEAVLTDLADGGIGVTARAADVPQLHTGDLFWIDMELPGERRHSELVVRLVHLRPVRNSDRVAMGWAFQPTDDIANYETYLRRLETLSAAGHPPGGVRRSG